MKKMTLLLALLCWQPVSANDTEHDVATAHPQQAAHKKEHSGHDHDHHVELAEITLSQQQISNAGITIEVLQSSAAVAQLTVAGEVRTNGYTSYLVTPRVDSVVLKRYVALGEYVSKGQVLVSLFSDEMAAAQADYVDRYTEWRRIKGIGLGSVSDKRIQESQTAYHAAFGRLRAYGLAEKEIRSLSVNSQNLGEYVLLAEASGIVLADDFKQGQRVRAGEEIMQIADETELWVEARLSPGSQIELPVGTAAKVLFAGQIFPARVAQEAHTIEPRTRTRIVRLLVDNKAHRLHPGMFVDVVLSTTRADSLLVPETALVRDEDGSWRLFVEQAPGVYQAHKVEREQQLGRNVVISGIKTGTRIVATGAFFLASQIAKSGFDPHNH